MVSMIASAMVPTTAVFDNLLHILKMFECVNNPCDQSDVSNLKQNFVFFNKYTTTFDSLYPD